MSCSLFPHCAFHAAFKLASLPTSAWENLYQTSLEELSAAQFYTWPKSLLVPTNAGWAFNASSDLEAKALNTECFILAERCWLEGICEHHWVQPAPSEIRTVANTRWSLFKSLLLIWKKMLETFLKDEHEVQGCTLSVRRTGCILCPSQLVATTHTRWPHTKAEVNFLITVKYHQQLLFSFSSLIMAQHFRVIKLSF